jgi:uncharacterized HAD superfamily protein
MKLIIDIDGTICTEEKQFSRALAKPLEGAIDAIKKLKSEGHTVILYSARTWAEYEMTVDWLNNYQIPYDQLILGKPQGDVWIDDRAHRFSTWSKILEVLK